MLFEKDGFILNSPMLCTMAKCEVYSEEERIVQMAHLTSIIIEINLFYSATSEEAVAFYIFPKAQETSNTLEYSLAQHFIPYCMSCARLCCDSIVQFKIQLQNSLKNGSL